MKNFWLIFITLAAVELAVLCICFAMNYSPWLALLSFGVIVLLLATIVFVIDSRNSNKKEDGGWPPA